MHVSAFIGLGSNLGEREALLASAVEGLALLPRTRVVRVSDWIETAPEGGPAGQGPYLNGAAELATELAPRALLDALLDLERKAGRVRVAGVANGPRALDLDLLLHGNARLAEPGLVVPHPRLEERLFVLRPLASLAPELVLPSGVAIHARIAHLERALQPREPARSRAFETSTLRRTRP